MKFVLMSRSPFTRRDGLFLAVAVMCVLFYVLAADGGFPLDDSWIHQVYGRNLAQAGEWAFIPGQPSAASTSPLYTVLLAIGYWLNLPYMAWTHLLGVMALAGAGMIGARMAERLLPNIRGVGLLTGLALIFAWHLIWAAASGMETMLFAMFTLVLVALTWDAVDLAPISVDRYSGQIQEGRTQVSVPTGILFGVLAALMTMTRPEGVLLAGLGGLAVMVYLGWARWQAVLRWCAGAAAGFIVVIAPYLLLNLHLAGGLLPNTANAKYIQHLPLLQRPYVQRLADMTLPILAGGQILLLPGVFYFVVLVTRRAARWRLMAAYLLPLLWFVVLIALYAARLPGAYQHGRYVIPALPVLIVLGVVGMAALVEQGRFTVVGRVLTRALVIAAVVTFVYFVFLGAGIYRQDVQIIDEEMVAPARWIADNLPPENLLAIHDIGAVGYFASRPILDIAGLIDPEVIPLIGDAGALWDYMRRYDARYLMAFPDQIPGHNVTDARLCHMFQSDGMASPSVGGPKMVIYALAWDGDCSS